MAAAMDIAGFKKALGEEDEAGTQAQPISPSLAGFEAALQAVGAPEKPAQAAQAQPTGVMASAQRFLGRRVGELAKLYGTSPAESFKTMVAPQLAAAADIVTGIVPAVAGEAAYWTRRAAGEQPEQAQAVSQQIIAPVSQPVGRATGMAAMPEYGKGALPEIMNFVAQNISKGADWIAEKTGMSKQDAEHAINTAAMVLPAATQLKRPIEMPAGAPEWRAGQAAPAMEVMPETVREAGPLSMGAAEAQMRPYKLTGEEGARGEFPQVKLHRVGKPVALPEQQTRAQIINEIMQGRGGVRTGAITGDENILRNEIERSKMTDKAGNLTPEAQTMKAQLAAEQNALTNYAEQRVAATQADPMLRDDYARAQRINDAMYGESGLSGEINRQKRAIYDEARQVVGDNPVSTPTVNDLLSSRQFQGQIKAAKQSDFTAGLKDLLDLHTTQGFKGTAPNSIASLEELRKAANALWTPDNSRFVKEVVNAIDDDIAQAGGPGLYQRARQVHEAEKKLFEPKGIQKIFGRVGENNIKEGVPLEKMVDQLNKLPFDEWSHIHDTFETLARGEMPGNLQGLEVTPELQSYAQSALSEMKGAIARDIYQSGASKVGEWNVNSANKAMNQYAKKIQYAFDPEEIKAFHNLNYGGQLMPSGLPYEGAGRQIRRIETEEPVSRMLGRAAKAAEAGAAAKGIPTFGLPTKGAEAVSQKLSQKAQAQAQRELLQDLERNARLPAMTLEEIARMGRK